MGALGMSLGCLGCLWVFDSVVGELRHLWVWLSRNFRYPLGLQVIKGLPVSVELGLWFLGTLVDDGSMNITLGKYSLSAAGNILSVLMMYWGQIIIYLGGVVVVSLVFVYYVFILHFVHVEILYDGYSCVIRLVANLFRFLVRIIRFVLILDVHVWWATSWDALSVRGSSSPFVSKNLLYLRRGVLSRDTIEVMAGTWRYLGRINDDLLVFLILHTFVELRLEGKGCILFSFFTVQFKDNVTPLIYWKVIPFKTTLTPSAHQIFARLVV